MIHRTRPLFLWNDKWTRNVLTVGFLRDNLNRLVSDSHKIKVNIYVSCCFSVPFRV